MCLVFMAHSVDLQQQQLGHMGYYHYYSQSAKNYNHPWIQTRSQAVARIADRASQHTL